MLLVNLLGWVALPSTPEVQRRNPLELCVSHGRLPVRSQADGEVRFSQIGLLRLHGPCEFYVGSFRVGGTLGGQRDHTKSTTQTSKVEHHEQSLVAHAA